MRLLLLLGLWIMSLLMLTPQPASARSTNDSVSAPVVPAVAGLSLAASPSLVDVGDAVTFALTARAWPGATSAVLSFVSPHHGFTGNMLWTPGCGCFKIAVALARRIHPIELAKAKATVRYRGGPSFAYASFQIRGLASNGRDLAPGGVPALTAWVSDPAPVLKQVQHYCAWVKTADGIGVAGFRISFVAHFGATRQAWYAGTTGTSGIVCSQRSIGSPKAGARVNVEVYANRLRAQVTFTPRAS